jgi:hypothetical protein
MQQQSADCFPKSWSCIKEQQQPAVRRGLLILRLLVPHIRVLAPHLTPSMIPIRVYLRQAQFQSSKLPCVAEFGNTDRKRFLIPFFEIRKWLFDYISG